MFLGSGTQGSRGCGAGADFTLVGLIDFLSYGRVFPTLKRSNKEMGAARDCGRTRSTRALDVASWVRRGSEAVPVQQEQREGTP